MNVRPRAGFGLVSVAAAFAIAGCGASEPTAERWAREANEACAEALEDVEALAQPMGLEEAQRYVAETLDISRRLADELDAIEAPAEIAPRAEEMVRLYRDAERTIERELAALRRGDVVDAGSAGADLELIGRRADRIALELGADECAREPGDERGDPDVDGGQETGSG